MAPFVRNPYNYDMNFAGDEDAIRCSDASLAKQSFAEEVDINTIVRRFGLSGELPENVPHILQGDFTNAVDFKTAMNMVVAAREAFMEQPAEVRARFHNDPQEFLEFTSSRDNLDEAIKLGLVREESIQARAQEVAAARQKEIDAAVALELEARKKAGVAPAGTVST